MREYGGQQDVIIALTSNAERSAQLFCGHKSGCCSVLDIEKKAIVREFVPKGDKWVGDSVEAAR